MALFGTVSTLREQAPRTAAFATAFAYLAEVLREGSEARRGLWAVAEGTSRRVELGGGVYAMEQSYLTKPRAEGVFESHRRHIDLQVLVEGREGIEVADRERLSVRQDYDAERDFMLHGDSTEASRLLLGAGEAAIFFPIDAHMPSVRTGGQAERVRKTVVKIPVA
jgi:biofilm protein TabA